MLPRSLYQSSISTRTTIVDPRSPDFRISDYGYGKEGFRIMARTKDGPFNVIKEFEVESHMKLSTHKEFYDGDNSDIVGSDVQENTVYLLAQQHGFSTPEEFALLVTKYFLDKYPHVNESHIRIKEYPWQRFGDQETKDSPYYNQPHNHAFIATPVAERYCDVVRKRGEYNPLVMSGIHGLRFLKTEQAPYIGYQKDQFRIDDDAPNRVLCSVVSGHWEYTSINGVDFKTHWDKVKEVILKTFAGNPETGVTTTSVQFTAYQTERTILNTFPEIRSCAFKFFNKLYIPFEFEKFRDFKKTPGIDVYVPNETPYGLGYAQLDRVTQNKL